MAEPINPVQNQLPQQPNLFRAPVDNTSSNQNSNRNLLKIPLGIIAIIGVFMFAGVLLSAHGESFLLEISILVIVFVVLIFLAIRPRKKSTNTESVSFNESQVIHRAKNPKWLKHSLIIFIFIVLLVTFTSLFGSYDSAVGGNRIFIIFLLLSLALPPTFFSFVNDGKFLMGKLAFRSISIFTLLISHIFPLALIIYILTNNGRLTNSGEWGWVGIYYFPIWVFSLSVLAPVIIGNFLYRHSSNHKWIKFFLMEFGFVITSLAILFGPLIVSMVLHPVPKLSNDGKTIAPEAEAQLGKDNPEFFAVLKRSPAPAASPTPLNLGDFKPAKITYVPNELKFVGTGKQFLDNKESAQYYDYYDCSVGGTTKFLYVFQYISPRPPITRESFSIPTGVETSDTFVLNNYALFENNKFLSTYVLKAYRNSTLVAVTADYECIGDLDPLTEMKKIVESMQ